MRSNAPLPGGARGGEADKNTVKKLVEVGPPAPKPQMRSPLRPCSARAPLAWFPPTWAGGCVQIQKELDSNQKRLGEAAQNEETDSIEENEKLLQSTYQGIQRVLARIRDLAPADLARADESGPP